MCPPCVETNSLQNWLDTAVCIRLFAIRQCGTNDNLICIECYVREDLFEEERETTYEGITRHSLHIGPNRNLEVCCNCRGSLCIAYPVNDCDACTLEISKYNLDSTVDEPPRERHSVCIAIDQTIIRTEILNFPNFV